MTSVCVSVCVNRKSDAISVRGSGMLSGEVGFLLRFLTSADDFKQAQ